MNSYKGNPIFNNGAKALPKNPSISCNWVFGNYLLAEELFAKDLQSFEICVLVNKNLCGKLFSSLESPKVFDGIFKVTSVLFFIPDFVLLSYELNNFTFKALYRIILYWYHIKKKKITTIQ